MESCVIRLVKKAGIDVLEIASVAPARAITIGQIVALYDSTGTICYGGAAIEEVGESYFQLKKQILTWEKGGINSPKWREKKKELILNNTYNALLLLALRDFNRANLAAKSESAELPNEAESDAVDDGTYKWVSK